MARTRSTCKRQSRLAFTPLPSSSPAAKGYNQQIQDRAATVAIDSPAERRKNDDDSIPTPAASLEQGMELYEGSDSEPIRGTQRQVSKRAARQQRLDFSSSRDPDSFSSPIKLSSPSRQHSTRRSTMFSSQRRRVVDVSSDEHEDTVVGGGHSAPIPIESENDNTDEMPTTAGKQARKRRRQRRGSHSSFITSSPPVMVESDSEVEEVTRRRKRRRQELSDEEEGEDEPITPKRRRLKKPRELDEQEREELAEDLDGLRDSDDEENEIPAHTPRSTQKTARKTALEQLKRRRSGIQQDGQSSDAQDDEAGSDEVEEIEEEEEDERPMSIARFFREDQYDAAFVDEDEDEDPLGIPEDMPIEYTRYASMRAKELFKYAVEWMVQKKINPAFQMTDQIYRLTFRKLNDETNGLVGSKFKSSAWTADFAHALLARPDIAYEPIDRNSAEHCMRDHCDACNRTNHPATFQIQFQGKPYYPETLENVGANDGYDDDDNDSSSDGSVQDDEADDRPAYDAEGKEIPPEARVFYVGKFCMKNASTAHALQHWRYHLNIYVVDYLRRQGYLAAGKIVERDQWSTQKRRKHANKVVDRMEAEGVVKSLWQDFKNNLDEARTAKQGRGRW